MTEWIRRCTRVPASRWKLSWQHVFRLTDFTRTVCAHRLCKAVEHASLGRRTCINAFSRCTHLVTTVAVLDAFVSMLPVPAQSQESKTVVKQPVLHLG